MSLFYKLLLVLLVCLAAVVVYDLFQGQIENPLSPPGVAYDLAGGQFQIHVPLRNVRVIYASMFGPGEPVMRVRDWWMTQFEQEYGDRLSADPFCTMADDERPRQAQRALARLKDQLPAIRRDLDEARSADAASQVQAAREMVTSVLARGVRITGLAGEAKPAEQCAAVEKALAAAEKLLANADAAGKLPVHPRVQVTVERRWQGRWVLSANRPRFLSGREVPDVLEGGKGEVLALAQDNYALPLDVPLSGHAKSPLDEPDTYGKPDRLWRDAFINSFLEGGRYFNTGPQPDPHVYLAPTTCFTYCIFYNELLFAKAGVKPPKTWPEFVEVCRKLKAAGITPLTSDMAAYSMEWLNWLAMRAIGPETYVSTFEGVPTDKPESQRQSQPPWTDPRYRAILETIREVRENYFDADIKGMPWPTAQRAFAAGSAAMMINGSWLVQETAGYRDAQTDKVFKLNCFSFPTWPGGREIDQKAAAADAFGLIICRQGGGTEHAVELVRYLSARDWPDMVNQNAQISCMRDATFPPALSGIAEDFRGAPVVYNRLPSLVSKQFVRFTLTPAFERFFLYLPGDADYIKLDQFITDMDATIRAYLAQGGEESYE